MIKKINNKKWSVQVYGQDRYGNRLRRRRVFNGSKAGANRLELELKMELENLKNGFMFTGFTYQEFLQKEFFPYVEENFPTEYPTLTGAMNKWCRSIMKIQLSAINPNDIQEILDNAGKTCSLATVKKLKGFMNRSFVHAMNGGLKSNPCENVKLSNKRAGEYQPAVLNKEEIKLLLSQAKLYQPRWYKIWAFAIFTGMRSGEMYCLLRRDIDLTNQIIDVSKSWSSKVGVKSTKSGKWRKVPIADALMPLIKELMIGDKNEWLLPHPPQWKSGMQAQVLKSFCRSIGIDKNIRFHDLRATFITQMFAAGSSIAHVQSICGHTDLKTTERYLRLSGVDVKGVTNKLQITLPQDHVNNVVNMF